MTIPEVFTELRMRNISMTGNGDKLHLIAPKGAISADLKAALIQHKDKLLLILRPDIPDFKIIWIDRVLSNGKKRKEPTFQCSRCGGRRFSALRGSDVLPSCGNCRPCTGDDERLYWIEP